MLIAKSTAQRVLAEGLSVVREDPTYAEPEVLNYRDHLLQAKNFIYEVLCVFQLRSH